MIYGLLVMNEMLSSISPYTVIKPLGQGDMGVVYLARSKKTHKQVALKYVRLPNPNLLQSIRREIYALSTINHPGIVRILEHVNFDKVRFVHDKIREIVFADLEQKKQVEPHKSAAEIIIKDHSRRNLSLIGFHLEKGNLPKKAMPYYLKAAKFALKQYAHLNKFLKKREDIMIAFLK